MKNSHTLQKTFEGDWTISFALHLPAKEKGFFAYVLVKGAHRSHRSPGIVKSAESEGYAVIIVTDTQAG